jgi:DNA-binding MarR family transcriptional regulator/GNAT superfamily N-acetyltransferase
MQASESVQGQGAGGPDELPAKGKQSVDKVKGWRASCSMAAAPLESCVQGMRHFNRFYTRKIGVLQEGLVDSALSLTEARVLYELARSDEATATEVRGELGLDAGYLSRILQGFQKRGWVQRRASKEDGRRQLLSLTRSGRAAFKPLDARSDQQVRGLLHALPPDDQRHLLQAMQTIETVLETRSPQAAPYVLRTHRPGDIGWVVHRHGVLYSEEWGYDERFEALVAEIVAEFVRNLDPARERCWIAERNGERVGSVFVVQKSRQVAKLRLLLVEPSARGLGIGKRLVEECIRFARQCRYRKVVLWTQSELKGARSIYEQTGFRLTATERHQNWGRKDLNAETWELEL